MKSKPEFVFSNDQSFEGLLNSFHRENHYTNFLSPLDIEYQKQYHVDLNFVDKSFLIVNDSRVLAAFIGSYHDRNGKLFLSAFGRSACFLMEPYIFSSFEKSLQKETLNQFSYVYSQADSIDFLDWPHDSRLGPFSLQLLNDGGSLKPFLNQELDIKKTEVEQRKELRKSYKSLVNWGLKNLDITVYDQSNITEKVFNNFRQLHINVAGKETRNKDTWDIQLEQIAKEEAFLVLGLLDYQLVTGAFFTKNNYSCYYAVSASIRELFDKPLSHSMIWTALNYARAKGCEVFHLGEQVFSQHNVSEKERNISKFKRGFGGDTKLQMKLNWEKA